MRKTEAGLGEGDPLPLGWTEEETNDVYAKLYANDIITSLKIINMISDDGLFDVSTIL